MSRPTSRVRLLNVEEFEARAVPALLGLSLPSLPHPALNGLLTTVENVANGLIGLVVPSDPAPPPGGGMPTVPTVPTVPPVPAPPVGEHPEPPVTPPGGGGPVAGPDPFTPATPSGTPPAASAPAADAPSAATSSTPVVPTVSPPVALSAPDADAPTAPAALPPATLDSVGASAAVEAAPSLTATTATTTAFAAEASPPAELLAGPAALMGIPVDPATIAVTPPDALPPGFDVAPAVPVVLTPPSAVELTAEAVLPDAVVEAEAEPLDVTSWGWSAAVAALLAGGYWAARRYRLLRYVGEVLFPAKVAVPA